MGNTDHYIFKLHFPIYNISFIIDRNVSDLATSHCLVSQKVMVGAAGLLMPQQKSWFSNVSNIQIRMSAVGSGSGCKLQCDKNSCDMCDFFIFLLISAHIRK